MESLAEFLQTKQLLLVVDNCEHVLDAVADLVEEISQHVPAGGGAGDEPGGSGARRRAHVRGAGAGGARRRTRTWRRSARRTRCSCSWSVPARPTPTSCSVRRTRSAVGQVCRRLDGVPLAIELAPARVTSMSPAELASALDRRFDLLAGGRRRAVKRQQTLRATIDWSYDLLDESQQRLLARLAVFAGGCTREAAEAICAGGPIEGRAVLGLLTDLVDRSLVVAERGGLDTRYRLLETIREYGEERLVEHGETDALRDRHARYYAEYAFRCNEGLWGPEQIEWGARMTADGENILAAFAHAVDTHDLDLAVSLLESTSLISVQTGYVLTLPVEPVLAEPGVEHHPGYPLVLMAAAYAAQARGEASLALEYSDAALDVEQALPARSPYTLDLSALGVYLSAVLAVSTGAWDEAAAAFLEAAEALRTAERMGYVRQHPVVEPRRRCVTPGDSPRLSPSRPKGSPSPARGMPVLINECLVALAQALSRQDPERARALLLEAAHHDLDYETYSELIRTTLAAAMIRDWPLTARFATRSIPHAHWMNHRPYLHGILTVSARALAETDPEAAATIQGAAYALLAIPAPTTDDGNDRRADRAHRARTRRPRRPDRRHPPRDDPPPRRSARRRTTPRAPRSRQPRWTPTPPSPTPSPASTRSSPSANA